MGRRCPRTRSITVTTREYAPRHRFVGRLTATDADELMDDGASSDEAATFQFAVSGYYKTLGDVRT
ncbi:MAG: hypothetical protein WKF45_04585, partial [Ilumatobacteraceae bacterium]